MVSNIPLQGVPRGAGIASGGHELFQVPLHQCAKGVACAEDGFSLGDPGEHAEKG